MNFDGLRVGRNSRCWLRQIKIIVSDMVRSKRPGAVSTRRGVQLSSEFFRLVDLHILCDIPCDLSSPFHTVMADETTDISNSEQATLFIHWVTDPQGIYWILYC